MTDTSDNNRATTETPVKSGTNNANAKMSPIPEDKPKGTASKGAPTSGRVGQYAGPYRLLETLGKYVTLQRSLGLNYVKCA